MRHYRTNDHGWTLTIKKDPKASQQMTLGILVGVPQIWIGTPQEAFAGKTPFNLSTAMPQIQTYFDEVYPDNSSVANVPTTAGTAGDEFEVPI